MTTSSNSTTGYRLALAAVWIGSVLACGACKPDRPNIVEARKAEAETLAKQTKATVGSRKAARRVASGGLDPSVLSSEQANAVVARIGERTITLGQLADKIAQEPPFVQARYATLAKRREFLERMVQFELLVAEALERKLEQTPRVRAAYKRALALALMEQAADTFPAEVSDDQMRAFYAANKQDFSRAEQRRAALLVVGTKEHAERLRVLLRSAIADTPLKARQVFGDWVAKRSIDKATRIVKGDLGFFDAKGTPEGRRIAPPKSAVTVAFGLERIGDISEPVTMDEGRFGLIQLTDRRPEQQRSFNQARTEVRGKILKARQAKSREAFIASLRQKAKVVVNEEVLKRLALKPSDGQTMKAKPDKKMLLPNDTSALRRHLRKRLRDSSAPVDPGRRVAPEPRGKTTNAVKLPPEEIQNRIERYKNKVKGKKTQQSGGQP